MWISPDPFDLRTLWSRRFLRGFATSFLLFAVVLVGVCGWFAWDQSANGTETEAVIVGREEGRFTTLTVAFTAEGGQRVVTDLRAPADAEPHLVGDVLRVSYVARDPHIAREVDEPPIDLDFLAVGGSILLVSLGVVVAYAWWFAPANLGRVAS